jgi:Fur family transcriptional regulator, ferric uptake regulator
MFLKSDSILSILKANGLRVTQARIAVLEVLMQQNGPISHQQIESKLEAQDSRIDRVTIYRTLHSLTECGILHRIMGIDRSFSYAYKRDDTHQDHHGSEHAHFVCERCTHTFCLTEVDMPKSIVTPTGFELKHTEVKLFGYCPECN